MIGSKPRDLLLSPGAFGKEPTARWRDDVPPSMTGKLGAAWVQHNYSMNARGRLGVLNLTMVGFQQQLAEYFPGITEDEQTLRKQLNGHLWIQMDDYMLWTQVLGARCIYYSTDRSGWLPPPQLVGTGPSQRPTGR